jgi:hypothetical protein
MIDLFVVAAIAVALHLAGRIRLLMPVRASDPLAKRLAFMVIVLAIAVTGGTGAMALSWLVEF